MLTSSVFRRLRNNLRQNYKIGNLSLAHIHFRASLFTSVIPKDFSIPLLYNLILIIFSNYQQLNQETACRRAQSCLTLCNPIEPVRLLCPWDFPGKNTGVGCHFLLHGIFRTQGSNPHPLHWQANSLPLSHLRRPHKPRN